MKTVFISLDKQACREWGNSLQDNSKPKGDPERTLLPAFILIKLFLALLLGMKGYDRE